jgi:ubiquinone/menaquinone biosynthesis C-methylase UbiE
MSVVNFQGSIADEYDRQLGPVIFTPYAKDLAQRIPSGKPLRVLELACGTGRLTVELKNVLASGSSITATDISEGMLSVAKARVGEDGVTWQVADMQNLSSFSDGTFDLVVAQFGFMLVVDYAKAFVETRRVLAPGGRLLFSVWSSEEKSPMFVTATMCMRTFIEDEAVKVKLDEMSRVGHRLSSEDIVLPVLSASGFSNCTVAPVPLVVTDTTGLANGLVYGTPYTSMLKEETRMACVDSIVAAFGASCAMEALLIDAQVLPLLVSGSVHIVLSLILCLSPPLACHITYPQVSL